MAPKSVDRMRHILDAIAKIERYLSGVDLDQFRVDEQKIDAVVRNIEIIGEAASGISHDIRARYPEVEWRIATATRNRLIHGYFNVDPGIIWSTAVNDLPRLKSGIEKIIEEFE